MASGPLVVSWSKMAARAPAISSAFPGREKEDRIRARRQTSSQVGPFKKVFSEALSSCVCLLSALVFKAGWEIQFSFLARHSPSFLPPRLEDFLEKKGRMDRQLILHSN